MVAVVQDGEGGSGSKRAEAEAEHRLRMYERAKLRWYFAIAEFNTPAAAAHVYNECDGSDFQESAITFDLRFVPDSEDFSGRQVWSVSLTIISIILR